MATVTEITMATGDSKKRIQYKITIIPEHSDGPDDWLELLRDVCHQVRPGSVSERACPQLSITFRRTYFSVCSILPKLEVLRMFSDYANTQYAKKYPDKPRITFVVDAEDGVRCCPECY